VSGRKGCLVGCAAVLGLVLLYPLYLLPGIIIPLTLGFLFPWEPPRAEEAPDEAVLWVMAPEDKIYNKGGVRRSQQKTREKRSIQR
jgi:hypothetical protein